MKRWDAKKKKEARSISKFNPSRRLYNKARKFNITNKEKVVKTSKQLSTR